MTQSLILIGVFLLILVCLPFALSRLKQHYGFAQTGNQGQSRLISAVAIGPQQRVVTVEVGPESARTWLVLGVTPQSVTCLHKESVVAVAPVAVATVPTGPDVAGHL